MTMLTVFASALVIWEAQFGDFANVAQVRGRGGTDVTVAALALGRCDPAHHRQLHRNGGEQVGAEICSGTSASARELERAWKVLDRDGNNKVVDVFESREREGDCGMRWEPVEACMRGAESENDAASLCERDADKPKIQSQGSLAACLIDMVRISIEVVRLVAELSVNGIESSALSKEEYFMFASAWIRRNDERTHNFCVVSADAKK
eukprot:755731-Hanusia_phi.AAC.1